MLKSIDTPYRGYLFRSRLEARYAVFFDELGIGWEYEKEGFILPNGTWYLPDFFLSSFNGGMWVEVKPVAFTEEEKEKCRQLCRGSETHVWLAVGRPDFRCYEVYFWNMDEVIEGDGIPNADQAEFENRMYGMSAYGEPGGMINFQHRDLLGHTFTNAVKEAQEARFEFQK